MSVEELKIREELEMDVERDLEEEIKDGIYRLALKLHRLYQHQKERTLNSQSDKQNERENLLSEVNINIKMEGGTTIQIKEIKKKEQGISRPNSIPRPTPNPAQNVQGKIGPPRMIKFDWEKSLRSGSNPLDINRKTEDKNRDVQGNERGYNINPIANLGSRRGKVDKRIKTGLLEVGWKW
ncbi:hypothetical protein BUALT_Bualt11G0022600 [Buddleja alternifolia]|uniref:Uncharacterized protein n=1 Tax=Buddleja alternifolia TaxID=168488 RepID=A0AAV6WY95_9LAMI|nr:hypothetical protein BUALT_Bualt11G0022600 [Buddleja alternifolia]